MFTKQQETLAENELWEMDEARLSGFGSILVESNSAQRDGLNKLNAENAEIKKDKIRFNDIQEALRLARDIKERFKGPSQGRGVSVNQKKHANHMMRLRSEIINEAYKQSKKKNDDSENFREDVKRDESSDKNINESTDLNEIKGMDWDDAVEKAFGRDVPFIYKAGGLNNEAGFRQLRKAGLEREEAYHIRDAARKATMDMIKKYDIPENKYEMSNDNFYGVRFNVTAFDGEREERNFFREVIRQTKQYARQKNIPESANIQESEAQVLDDLQRFLEDYFMEEVRLWSQGDAAKAQISGLMGDGWDADMIEANAQELHREQAFQQIISGVYEFNGAVHDEDSDILTLYFRVL